MALNQHMSAAVAEIDSDIEDILNATVFATRGELKRLKAARDTIEAMYGGGPSEEVRDELRQVFGVGRRRYTHGGHALATAAALAQPLTALALAGRVGFSRAAASKCLKRWLADGWVRKVRHGGYIRTGKFPATVIPAE